MWLVLMFIVGMCVAGVAGVALEESKVLALRSVSWGGVLAATILLGGGLFFAAVTIAVQQTVKLRQLLKFIGLVYPDHLQEVVDRVLGSRAEAAGRMSDRIIELQRGGLNAVFSIERAFSNPDDARASFQEVNENHHENHQRYFRRCSKEVLLFL